VPALPLVKLDGYLGC